jgi:hypothetical protein
MSSPHTLILHTHSISRLPRDTSTFLYTPQAAPTIIMLSLGCSEILPLSLLSLRPHWLFSKSTQQPVDAVKHGLQVRFCPTSQNLWLNKWLQLTKRSEIQQVRSHPTLTYLWLNRQHWRFPCTITQFVLMNKVCLSFPVIPLTQPHSPSSPVLWGLCWCFHSTTLRLYQPL